MLTKVYNNVARYRLLDTTLVDGAKTTLTVEDVTKVGLPTIKHSTDTIDAAGMAVAVDVPNLTHLDAMDFTVYHNNGVNCRYLSNPGKHVIEFRTARQKYEVKDAEIDYESVKYIVTGIHVETQKGDIETGSPYGSTEKYSLVKYEEYIGDKLVAKIDAMAGILEWNGQSYTDKVESLL